MKALTKRNRKIYLEKMGYESVTDNEPVKNPMTYRALTAKYNLSLKRIQDIISRERQRLMDENDNNRKTN